MSHRWVDFTEEFVQLGEVRLNVATAREGPAVLLLHGFPDSWQLWRHRSRRWPTPATG